jgi:2-oxoglutarate ferredoxin oxidoreductase subunit alpha
MKALVPAPVRRDASVSAACGVIYFGSTTPAMEEALVVLEQQGGHLDALRVRAFPFSDAVMDFIAGHDRVFVVEQNRDGQLRSLLINEGQIDPARLPAVLHYDGTPITARFIVDAISKRLDQSIR